MRVGVVGCGQIGSRRATVIHGSLGDDLVVVSDVISERSQALADAFGCRAAANWMSVTRDENLDAIVVATTNDFLAPIAADALRHGRHVLVEKPMARNVAEAEELLDAGSDEFAIKVGFNHRFHPALARGHELVVEGVIGRVIYIRCRYGHGGRPDYHHEWRADRNKSGGGELLDQGIHAIDLGRWFMGEFDEASGIVDTYVWHGGESARTAGIGPIKGSSVEDNAFALLRTTAGQTMCLHASWTQWRNLFSFEVFGDRGHILVEGLGGSYGIERLTVGRRNMDGGPPDEETTKFDAPDQSWVLEWREFTRAISDGRQPMANGADGLAALRAVEAVYTSSRLGSVTRIS